MCKLPNIQNAAEVARQMPVDPNARRFTEKSDTVELHIDGEWYDVTKWADCHPGGREILEFCAGQDVTDVFHSLHAPGAFDRLKRVPKVKCAPPAPVQPKYVTEFRKFRSQLISEGYFQRNYWKDAALLLSLPLMMCIGTSLAWTYPLLSILILGVCMQQCGWIAHDYCHGTDTLSKAIRYVVSGPINAFERKWWSDKHNGLHHAFVNIYELDEDLQNEPVFYLLRQAKVKDSWMRKYQHVYFWVVVSFLYVSWRIQSMQSAIARRNYKELAGFAINYAWLFYLPWYVSIGSVLMGGWLVGVVVTASHQAEPIVHTHEVKQYDFVGGTFIGTADAETHNFVEEWLWGGMQYQLEHHLFPTMPKYNYAKVAPKVRQWSKEVGLEYKCENSFDLIMQNVRHLTNVAEQ